MLLTGLRDLTYADRLRELADRLDALSDELAGTVAETAVANEALSRSGRERWIAEVKSARNGFAHQARRSPDDIREYAGKMFTLFESLRWFLTATLLAEIGIPSSDVAGLFKSSSGYHLFRQRAVHFWPEVYGDKLTDRCKPPCSDSVAVP